MICCNILYSQSRKGVVICIWVVRESSRDRTEWLRGQNHSIDIEDKTLSGYAIDTAIYGSNTKVGCCVAAELMRFASSQANRIFQRIGFIIIKYDVKTCNYMNQNLALGWQPLRRCIGSYTS